MLFKKILRAITSRYFTSLAFIGIELFLLFWLQSYLNDYLFAFHVLSYIISVLTLLFIINSKTIPETKMPWMIIILVFQPFGALLYIILGRRLITIKEKKFLKRLKQDRKNLFDVDDTVLDTLKDIDNEAYQKAKSLSHDSFNSLCEKDTVSNLVSYNTMPARNVTLVPAYERAFVESSVSTEAFGKYNLRGFTNVWYIKIDNRANI